MLNFFFCLQFVKSPTTHSVRSYLVSWLSFPVMDLLNLSRARKITLHLPNSSCLEILRAPLIPNTWGFSKKGHVACPRSAWISARCCPKVEVKAPRIPHSTLRTPRSKAQMPSTTGSSPWPRLLMRVCTCGTFFPRTSSTRRPFRRKSLRTKIATEILRHMRFPLPGLPMARTILHTRAHHGGKTASWLMCTD